MAQFIALRLAQMIAVIMVAAIISFSLVRFVGDPVNNMVGQTTTIAEREEKRESLGLNQPLPVQFIRFLGNMVEGDLGISYRYGIPVSTLLRERFPATLELSVVSVLLSLVLGVPLGIWTALHRKTLASELLLTASLIGVALPTFLIGIGLISVFSVWLGWLPAFGRGGGLTTLGGWTTGFLSAGGLKALILPSLTLALFQMTMIMRLVRAEMLEVLRTEYIRFARARGIDRSVINFDHALRNTLIPVITIVGLQFGNVFAFSIIVETVFQWPGLGLLIIQAIQFADIPLLAAYLVLIALIFACINLIVDLLYAAVDPRVRTQLLTGSAA